MQTKQTQIVVNELLKLGGLATLGLITQETLLNPEFIFSGKTPQANIRRIVQNTDFFYKIRPGLYSLNSLQAKNEASGILLETEENKDKEQFVEFTHGYYQGLLITIGNLRGLKTFSPNSDNNRIFIKTTLKEIRTLDKIPEFSYDHFVKRSSTVDAIWFHETKNSLMPNTYFEVEHSTDIQNSILKYIDLKDFSAKKYIVADQKREKEFNHKMKYHAFESFKDQILFLSYEQLVKQYEIAMDSQNITTKI